MYNEPIAKAAAILIFVGFNFTFFPQFIVGYLGMPRRYHWYPEEFQFYHVMSTAGSSVLAIGFLMPAFYLMSSLFFGKEAGPNPWRAIGLEWSTQSPPLAHNFEEVPSVTWEAYEYDAVPDLEDDPVERHYGAEEARFDPMVRLAEREHGEFGDTHGHPAGDQ